MVPILWRVTMHSLEGSPGWFLFHRGFLWLVLLHGSFFMEGSATQRTDVFRKLSVYDACEIRDQKS